MVNDSEIVFTNFLFPPPVPSIPALREDPKRRVDRNRHGSKATIAGKFERGMGRTLDFDLCATAEEPSARHNRTCKRDPPHVNVEFRGCRHHLTVGLPFLEVRERNDEWSRRLHAFPLWAGS